MTEKIGRIVLVVAVVAALLWLAGMYIGTKFVYNTVDYVVDSLSNRSGLSPFLVRGLVILLTIPFFWAVAKFTGNVIELLNLGWTTPLAFYRKPYGIVIIVYVGIFFITMYMASLDAYAYKFCAETPEGIWTSDAPGKDPVYGMESKPCLPLQIKELRNGKGKLAAPHEIHIANVNTYTWFNGVTAQPLAWYDSVNGDYRFFDRPGNDPNTGQALKPVTPQFVQQLKQQEASKEESRKRTAEEETARSATAKETADLQTFAGEAQKEFEIGNYVAAKEACDQVLKRDARNEPCKTIQQHANVKVAQQLVSEGQEHLERGEIDEALWNAEKAIKLDPSNPNATKLKQFALQMKPHGLN
jgi:hypothetical protein